MRSASCRVEEFSSAGNSRSHCSRFSQVRWRLAYCLVASASAAWHSSLVIFSWSMLRISCRPRVRSAVEEHGPNAATSSTAPSRSMRAARRAILWSSSGTFRVMVQPGPRGFFCQFRLQKESGLPPARTISRLRST